MSKTIVVVGYGPGVSNAVAERFGAEGFAVALVARSQDRIAAGAAALKAKGIAAAAIAADASDPASIAGAIEKARAALGPITAIHWNAYGGGEAGDLIAAAPAASRAAFDVAIVGLLAAVQAALPDLKAAGDGAVLVTNGAFGDLNPQIDALAVGLKSMGLAMANAAKHKLVGLLAARLKDDNVFIGEVMIAGAVKGTGFDTGGPAIDPARIAGEFWRLYRGRGENYARVS
ncbi:MAG TPA: SDR family NAD(P)-dependent oxidoreductase [Caulobacteraceae bacterium]|nr:SDR family NAD(P)-dependent oxidoreductase [Caulobacteraceae bacterium]